MDRPVIRFEQDPSLTGVEILVRAPAQTDQTNDILDRLRALQPEAVQVFDGTGNVCILTPGEIVSASVEGRLVRVVTESGSWYTRQTLQSLETALGGGRLIRISRYEMVNLDKVLRYDFTITGTLRLELMGGTETWASRRCIPDIRKRLKAKE